MAACTYDVIYDSVGDRDGRRVWILVGFVAVDRSDDFFDRSGHGAGEVVVREAVAVTLDVIG